MDKPKTELTTMPSRKNKRGFLLAYNINGKSVPAINGSEYNRLALKNTITNMAAQRAATATSIH